MVSEQDQKFDNQRNAAPRRSGGDRRDANIEIRAIDDKHYIFRERETAQQAFIIQSGTVEIVKSINGEEVVLGTFNKGGMFGEMALIDDMPRMASARAVGPVVVKVVTRDLMEQKISQMDPFARGLIKILSGHVRAMAKSMGGKAT